MRTRMQVGVVVFASSLAGGASGQTFAEYFMDGFNLTDPGRGVENADRGDVIRMSLRVYHDALSFAGGKVDIIAQQNVGHEDITITEDGFSFPFDPWEIGREPLFRIVASDGPADATRPHNEDVIAFEDGDQVRISDVNNDFIDFASTPPGLGGLAGGFPLEDGEAIFVFDWVYQGGGWLWVTETSDTARLWRNGNDINGAVVDARDGDPFTIPAPSPLALAGIGLLLGLRRRRRFIEE